MNEYIRATVTTVTYYSIVKIVNFEIREKTSKMSGDVGCVRGEEYYTESGPKIDKHLGSKKRTVT